VYDGFSSMGNGRGLEKEQGSLSAADWLFANEGQMDIHCS